MGISYYPETEKKIFYHNNNLTCRVKLKNVTVNTFKDRPGMLKVEHASQSENL